MGESSITEPQEKEPSEPPGAPSVPGARGENPSPLLVPSRPPGRLPDEDVLSLHDEALTGRLTFEPRPSWSGGQIADVAADPLLGTTLHDTYLVSHVIGEGGMGRVYQVQHTRIASKRFALKVLHAEFARNAEIRRRFQHEAEAAAKIEHPGVVGTYDVGETPGRGPYMVCEYLAGEDLNDYLLERGALPARTVVHIGKQLCGAISAAHASGVIHRDLKPHNVFVIGQEGPPSKHAETNDPSEFPTVKVLDFGLSRFVEGESDLTKTGIILGTPGYMAPEQAGGLPTDHRTDVYGIGALLYATATGRAPFKEDSPQKTVLSVLSQVPARPRDLVPSIPVNLEIVIQKAMARDPAARYQSAGEMEVALAELDASWIAQRRRTGLTPNVDRGAPRLELVLLTLVGLALWIPSSCLGVLALLEARGFDYRSFRPSALEWLLLALLAVVALFPLGYLGLRFFRRVWKDSARVAALGERIKGPLVAALVAYGVTALVALCIWGLEGARSGKLSDAPSGATLGWYVVLPVNALLAASVAFARDASKKAKSPIARALAGVGFPAGAVMAGVFLLIFAATSPLGSMGNTNAAAPTEKSDEGATASAASPPEQGGTISGDAERLSTKTSSKGERTGADETRERAPQDELALAQSQSPEAIEELLKKYPRDGNVLEALVLAHASRADTLDRSVEAISRLLEVEPAFSKDPDVLFILKKALLAQGKVHALTFDVVKDRMGTDGGELVYQLMTEQPKQQGRLKNIFFALRKAGGVSPATAVAYDLRYTTSCQGRLAHLARAEKDGDLRSVNQLAGLSTAPKKCGWGRTCQPACPVEAARFRQSIEVMRERLAAPAP